MIEDYLLKKYGKYLKAIHIFEKKHKITMDRIIINDESRNMGIGTKIMMDLIKYTDENNKTIGVTPSEDFGGVKSKLIKFYKRFGFVSNKGRNKNFEFTQAMVREPKISENKTINEMLKSKLIIYINKKS